MSEVEAQAMFDAWAHSEAGLTFEDMAHYTPQEISRIQLGYFLREQPAEDSRAHSIGAGGLSQREYDVQTSRADWLDELEQN